MGTIKIIGFDEDGNAQRLKIRIARILDYDPVTGADKENIRDSLGVSPDATGLVRDDIGSGAGEISVNGMLGSLAFQDADSVSVDTLEVTDKVDGPLGIDGSPGSYAYSGADDLVVGDASGSRGITISTGSSDTGALYFGDAATTGLESYRGMVRYSHSSDSLELGTLSQVRATIDSSGNIDVNTGDITQRESATIYNKLDTDSSGLNLTVNAGQANVTRNLIFKSSVSGGGVAERMRLDGQGRLGVNQTAPSTNANSIADDLVVGNTGQASGITVVGGTGSTSAMAFGSGGTTIKGGMVYDHPSNSLQFSANSATRWLINSSGNLQANGAYGIDFGTTTTGSGVTVSDGILSDYEVGTWEPTYAPSSGSFTTVTMTRNTAMYVKVGKQVTVFGYILTSDLNTTGGSGNVQISGLPFISSNPGFSSVSVGYTSNWGTNHPAGGYVASNASIIYLTERKTDIHGSLTEMAVSNLNSVTGANYNALMFSATYLTTS